MLDTVGKEDALLVGEMLFSVSMKRTKKQSLRWWWWIFSYCWGARFELRSLGSNATWISIKFVPDGE
ncbi:hypothetical protein [Desulfuromonas versatilis]|uniref:hypothetical protein n=1 Tax=Desulfuromonas versatilis TaxID=2802975 RepID=UPI001C85C044|nr:hypothetical protein [Desulfuromonas versatilis]